MALCASSSLGGGARWDPKLSSLELKELPEQLNLGFLEAICALDSPSGNLRWVIY